jgi:hypothetical protein
MARFASRQAARLAVLAAAVALASLAGGAAVTASQAAQPSPYPGVVVGIEQDANCLNILLNPCDQLTARRRSGATASR